MKKYWDDLEVGEKLLKIEKKPITKVQIAQFAAASNEFNPLNLDDEYAKSAGFSGAFAPNIFSLALIEETLFSFANNIRIISLNGTFHRLLRPNDRISVNGLLIQHYKKNEEYRIKFSLWCQNQNNDIVMKGHCLCLMFKNEQQEKSQEQKIPKVSKASHEELIAKSKEEIKIENFKAKILV